MTQAGLLSATAVTWAAVAVFAAAALVGLFLITVGGWPILVVGVFSILAAVTYTGGPWPFGYHGLGEVFVFVFFGFVAVLGTYYLQTTTVTWLAVTATLPVACTATAILVVNNLRDRAGTRTRQWPVCAPSRPFSPSLSSSRWQPATWPPWLGLAGRWG